MIIFFTEREYKDIQDLLSRDLSALDREFMLDLVVHQLVYDNSSQCYMADIPSWMVEKFKNVIKQVNPICSLVSRIEELEHLQSAF